MHSNTAGAIGILRLHLSRASRATNSAQEDSAACHDDHSAVRHNSLWSRVGGAVGVGAVVVAAVFVFVGYVDVGFG